MERSNNMNNNGFHTNKIALNMALTRDQTYVQQDNDGGWDGSLLVPNSGSIWARVRGSRIRSDSSPWSTRDGDGDDDDESVVV